MNEVAPKVSIIMPAFNVESYIEDSIGSIMRQSLKDIEIICVNDGSCDRTPEILHSLALQDTRIVLFNQINQGQSRARNIGLSLARGEYIYFFDSDDLLTEDALEVLYNHAKRMDAQLTLFNGFAFFDNEALEFKYSHKKTMYDRSHDYKGIHKGDELFAAMINNDDYIVSPCLQFFEQKYLCDNNIEFKEGIIHEDNLFSMQALLLCERVCYLNANLFKRRVRENSTMTSEINVDHYIGHYTGLIEMLRFIMIIREQIDDRAIIAAKERLINQYRTAIYEYELLPGEQRRQPVFVDPTSDFLSGILYSPLPVFKKIVNKYKKEISKERKEIRNLTREVNNLTREVSSLQRQLAKKQEKLKEEREKKAQLSRKLAEARGEIEAIKRSKTYLTGRAITFFPRVIRRLFNTYIKRNAERYIA
jgi:glycosyltransferase involved in cell wall biosynthesis